MRINSQQDPTLPQGFTVTFKQRFWAKVDKKGPIQDHVPQLGCCWTWVGSANELGYGHMQKGRRGAGRIRATWASCLIHGNPVPKGLNALHRCDNPRCVNPDHIFHGTHMQNVHDKIDKGRAKMGIPKCGPWHPNAVLTEDDVRFIRKSTLTTRQLAIIMHIHASTVLRARSRITYSNLL